MKYSYLNVLGGKIKIIRCEYMSNIEKCMKYIRKQELANSKIFEFSMNKEKDEVIITKYIANKYAFRVVEIPSFVTGFEIEDRYELDSAIKSIFSDVTQSLKVINKSQITDIRNLFSNYNGEKLDLSEFDTSKVTNMSCMFNRCRKLKDIDFSGFDTSKVKDMSGMFFGCYELGEIDLSEFDTSRVKDMASMFTGCYSLKSINLSNFNVDRLKDVKFMFRGCNKLESVDMSSFDMKDKITVTNMFNGCVRIKDVDTTNKMIKNELNKWMLFLISTNS